MNADISPKSQTFEERLSSLGTSLRGSVKPQATPFPAISLIFSVSDGDWRASVVNVSGPSFEAAWQEGVERLRQVMVAERLGGRWLRVDWVETVEASSWARLQALLTKTKRNYFRFGIALDAAMRFVFTEQELNANAMLYGGNGIDHAVVNRANFLKYAKTRHPDLPRIGFGDHTPIFLFATRGIFCDERGALHPIDGTGLDSGRRSVPALDAQQVMSLVEDASNYLARQVTADGSFIYGYHACFDRPIQAYNTLRHASTTFAMIEAWEVTRDAALKRAIDLSLTYLTETLVKTIPLSDGTQAAFLVDVGNEIKLGGNAVAILALTKFMSATGTDIYLDLAEKLAFGIRAIQDAHTGAFAHVLNYPDLSVKQDFRIIYYEGEAAFGLMRLYGLTGDPRWLAMVEKAFDHFIAHDHWKHHDHWLGYCVNELTRYRPQARYFRFGICNIGGYLDFVENRITTFPTLLELMMAARETLSRVAADPELHSMLDEIDLVHFERALEKRAHRLLNGHFWPELAMYYRKPDRIVGSFFIRHHAFRVRIDDVEHYLSGLVAYRRYLAERSDFRQLITQRAHQRTVVQGERARRSSWTAEQLAEATGGTWIRHPPAGWTATGVATFAPAMKPGDMALLRADGETVGIRPDRLDGAASPAGIITTDLRLGREGTVPLLHVADGAEAVLAMGRYARARINGTVLAVTGSAGKTTTVAMLAHALLSRGEVAKSSRSANLANGVACNLASMPWDAPHVVLELAVGRMAVSARIARPHVALFTNILPAHLCDTKTVTDIATTKSAIFLGMPPGAIAIINRDMLEWNIVEDAARRRGLTIVTYGTSADCAFRLLDYDPRSGTARACIDGRDIDFRVGAAGRHMAMNGLAVLATISALGHPLEPAIAQLESFEALPGRGEELVLTLDARRITVIDDAYNANPGSMRAALERLSEGPCDGRRIAVLGQMAELGPQAASYHTELAALMDACRIDRVYAIGELYADFWEQLSPARKGTYAQSRRELRTVLDRELADGDAVLLKGSNSAQIHELVEWMKARSATA